MIALTDGPLIRLSPPSPTRGEGHGAESSQSGLLLPLWEKVPEGRMRGRAVGTGLQCSIHLEFK